MRRWRVYCRLPQENAFNVVVDAYELEMKPNGDLVFWRGREDTGGRDLHCAYAAGYWTSVYRMADDE